MYKTINVPLSENELLILRQLAGRECRRPQDQVRYLILAGLGLTQSPPDAQQKNTTSAKASSGYAGGVTVNS